MTKKKYDPRNDKIFALHRYLIWANDMRNHFQEILMREDRTKVDPTKLEMSKLFMYMSLWYGMLYVVIEGWRDELKLSDPVIDKYLESDEKVQLLRKYRNAVFHYQPDYETPKIENFLQVHEANYKWSYDLHTDLGDWFIEYFRKLDPEKVEKALKGIEPE